jgi:glycosyltransferase involved in cell wall biosynthesis
VVLDGENGCLVQPKDSEALTNALLRLIHNKSLRKYMGKRGREIAVECFNSERVAKETIDLYKTLLLQNAGPIPYHPLKHQGM